ncbi:7013_t:CDS:2, partial [Dentiscutata erythropus]
MCKVLGDDSISIHKSSVHEIGSFSIQEEGYNSSIHEVYNSSVLEEIITNDELLLREFEKAQEILKTLDQKDKDYVTSLINKITKLQQQVGDQKQEILSLKKQLCECQEEIIQLKDLYQGLYEENEKLNNQWNSRFCDQHKHVQAITDITITERESLYKDIESIMGD